MINHIKRLRMPSTQTPDIEPPTKSLKRGITTSEKDTPQPTRASQRICQAHC